MPFISNIVDWLVSADQWLLLSVNGLHSPLLDNVMWILSDRWIWVPLYLILAWLLIRRVGMRAGVLALVLIAGLITATDQTCASLIRPLIARLRPTNPENPLSAMLTIVNGYRGGPYGFPSCHAANTMALAVFLSLVYHHRAMSVAIVGWALCVSLSRVYLGVHYPSDLFAGFVVGAFYAVIFYYVYRRLNYLLFNGYSGPVATWRYLRTLFYVAWPGGGNG